MSAGSPLKLPPTVPRANGGGLLRALLRASTPFWRDGATVAQAHSGRIERPFDPHTFEDQDTVPAVLMVEEPRLPGSGPVKL